jgi:hypothetical protein
MRTSNYRTIYFNPVIWEKVCAISDRDNITINSIVREGVELYIQNDSKSQPLPGSHKELVTLK